MKRWLRRITIAVVVAIVFVVVVGVGVWYYLPTPKSPPLTDRQGVVLNAETEAKLVEIVFQAAREDDFQTVVEFLREGFSPNVRSTRGDALLIVAAYHDSRQVVGILLRESAIEIEARNRMGLTAVSAAAFKGFDAVLRDLLSAGANPDAVNGVNQSALMFAALSGKSAVVRTLLDAGADPDRIDAMGNTALSLARWQGAKEVLSLLESSR